MSVNAAGEAESGPLRHQFDRLMKPAFSGSSISSDGGLLLHRVLEDALGLTHKAAGCLIDPTASQRLNDRCRFGKALRRCRSSTRAGFGDLQQSRGITRLVLVDTDLTRRKAR